MKMRKKAQTEIMGLVIIVIIITIGFFLTISLKPIKTEKPLVQVYGDEKLASDFLITLLETQTNCRQTSIKNLAIDCIKENYTGIGDYDCGEKTCEYLNETIQNITNKTLTKWNYAYKLTLEYQGPQGKKTLIDIKNNDCDENKPQITPGVQPLPLIRTPGTAQFILRICD